MTATLDIARDQFSALFGELRGRGAEDRRAERPTLVVFDQSAKQVTVEFIAPGQTTGGDIHQHETSPEPAVAFYTGGLFAKGIDVSWLEEMLKSGGDYIVGSGSILAHTDASKVLSWARRETGRLEAWTGAGMR